MALPNEIIIPMVVGMGLYIAGFLAYISSIQKKKYERHVKENDFDESILNGLGNKSITSLNDIVNIYKGITEMSSDDLTYRPRLSFHLRKLIFYVVSGKKHQLLIKEEKIGEFKEKLTQFINENEEQAPFSDLPLAERNALSDLTIFLDNKDFKSSKRKTAEIAGMLQARHDDMSKLAKTNRWTVPLAWGGIILTIFFGMLSAM